MSSRLALVNPEWRGKCQSQRHKTLRQRFDEKTVRDEASGCLLWMGAHDKDGYGFIRISGKNIKAHRVALEWRLGRPLLVTEMALHRCDRPSCVEGLHLFPGDNSENQVDSIVKGRKGSQRLTVTDITAIRSRYAAGESQASLSRLFGIHDSHINKIVRRKKWKHVA